MSFDDKMEEVLLSDCCGAEVVYDDICSECLEYCERVIELRPSLGDGHSAQNLDG